MNMNNEEAVLCEECSFPLIYIDHYEYDGLEGYGSHEPYYECVNNCPEPTEPRIDTHCRDIGVLITHNDNQKLSYIL